MSIRFLVGIVHLAIVCIIGWQVRERIPVAARPIVALVWCSLLTDLACYFAYQEKLPFLPIQHLYTFVEFLLEAQFVSAVTDNAHLKKLVAFAVPFFFLAWLGFHLAQPAMALGDEPLIILSDVIMNVSISFALTGQLRRISDDLHGMGNNSIRSLLSETARQIWASPHGKIFAGLFAYNFFGLIVFGFQLSFPESDTRYAHSASHLVKNTCILFAFLQSLEFRRKQ
jgi:hypothetical protein